MQPATRQLRLFHSLTRLTPRQLWLVSIPVSVVLSEVIVCGMGMLLKGEVTYDYLLTGFVTSLFAGSAVVGGISLFLAEQKKVEEALRRSEQRFRDVSEAAGEVIWEVDAAGRYTYVSEKVAEGCGYSVDEMIGHYPAEFMATDDARLAMDKLAQAMREGSGFRDLEHRVIRKDGRLVWKSVSGVPIIGPGGEVIGFRGASLDITRLKVAETSLSEVVATLEQRIREEVEGRVRQERLLIQQSRLAAMGEMIGNIAHQWRQPLNALNLLLSNIQDAYEFNQLDEATMAASIEKGSRLIRGMSATIDDFRNFFRPNKEKGLFSLKAVVDDALGIISASLYSHNISVSVAVDEDVIAYGFRNEYSQALLNILSNAKESLVERHVRNGIIQVAVTRQHNEVHVTVRDNAGGIAPDILPKVFDPYFTTKEKGTGIGLYMSKMIIENNMGGKIEIANVGDGTQVTLISPCQQEPAARPVAPSAAAND